MIESEPRKGAFRDLEPAMSAVGHFETLAPTRSMPAT
jgi:hypothetical protein